MRTAQLPTEKRAPQQGLIPPSEPSPQVEDRGAQAKPWIVVGIIAVLAIIASIIVVNVVRGAGEAGPTAAPSPQQTSGSAQTPTPSEEPDETEEPADEDGDVPQVDPGETMTLSISQWGVSGELSNKFGSTNYTLENGNTELWLSSPLINQLPCEGPWGVVRTAGGGYEVLKPAERCAAAPEVYDELWGLTDAFVKSIR